MEKKLLYILKQDQQAFLNGTLGIRKNLNDIMDAWQSLDISEIKNIAELAKLAEDPKAYAIQKQKEKIPVLAGGVEVDFSIKLPVGIEQVVHHAKMLNGDTIRNRKYLDLAYFQIEDGEIKFTETHASDLDRFSIYLETNEDFARYEASENLRVAVWECLKSGLLKPHQIKVENLYIIDGRISFRKEAIKYRDINSILKN